MRKKIFLVISEEDTICPECGSPLCRRDRKLRVHKEAGGKKSWFAINRLKCTNEKCRRLHNELPDCMIPYKHYGSDIIEDEAMNGNIARMKCAVTQIVDVNSKTSHIREAASEVNEAMESCSQNAHEIMKMTEKVETIAEKSKSYGSEITKMDDRLSMIIHNIYIGLNDGIPMLTNDEFIATLEKAKDAHMNWLGRLEDMVNQMETIPLQFNPNRCAFGHFYNAIEVNNKELVAGWKAIGEIHSQFHTMGKDIQLDIQNQDEEDAKSKLARVTELSKKMLTILQNSIDQVKKMSEEGLTVF